MNVLTILLTTSALFLLFITPSLVKRRYVQKRYMTMLDKYKEDYKNRSQPNNIYNLADYRRSREDLMPDDIIKQSLTHDLVWSDEYQDYIRTPRNLSPDDEEL